MDITPLLLIVYFFVFLFFIYALCIDDYALFRKNISIERIFNIAFIVSALALLVSRLVYVLFHFNTSYLNPFVLLLFPYFPGLSLIGCFIGGILGVVVFSKKKRFPTAHVADLFHVAFFASLSLSSIGQTLYTVVSKKILDPYGGIRSLLFFFVFVLLLILFKKHAMKEGTIAFFGTLLFLGIMFSENIAHRIAANSFPIIEDFVLLGLILVTAVGFIMYENNIRMLQGSRG